MRNPSQYHLRARGNLTYLEFIRLVQRIWAEAHPDIPIVARGNGDPATYPCIYYSLELRKPHSNEPKVRYRETIRDGGDTYVVGAQRFTNLVIFTAITESNPELADQTIEAFEDFMLEYTPVFKELGISEFMYSRRLPDSEENRSGSGVVRRSVSYMVTTEKVFSSEVTELEEILVRARVWEEEGLTISTDQANQAYLPTNRAAFDFYVTEEPDYHIDIPGTSFPVQSLVYIAPRPGETLPTPLVSGYYVIMNKKGSVGNLAYQIAKVRNFEKDEYGAYLTDPVPLLSAGRGLAFYIQEDIGADLIG